MKLVTQVLPVLSFAFVFGRFGYVISCGTSKEMFNQFFFFLVGECNFTFDVDIHACHDAVFDLRVSHTRH